MIATVDRAFVFIASLILVVFVSAYGYADTKYVVRKGDNPSSIAKKFGVSTEDILKANTLDPNRLKPGTKLTIPSDKREIKGEKAHAKKKKRDIRKGKETETLNDMKECRSEDNDGHFVHHVVRKGDSLFSISRKYSVPVTRLRELNYLKSERLKIGQRLLIRFDKSKHYTVKKGDTISAIARRFAVDSDELIKINNLKEDPILPGQKILLEAKKELKEAQHSEAALVQGHPETGVDKASEAYETGGLELHERLILFAKKLLNIPYRFGGNSLIGIDCSAYVKKVYGLIGIDLPRSAREQFEEGKPVDGNELATGDLVFFRTYASFPSHVGIYLGNNLFIHASSRSKKVTIDSLKTPYYLKRFIGAKRFIDIKEEQDTRIEG